MPLFDVREGDTGTLSFENARVVDVRGDLVTFTIDGPIRPVEFAAYMAQPGITFTHVHPEHWPPQPGSVWENRAGDRRWHAVSYAPDHNSPRDMQGADKDGARVILVGDHYTEHTEDLSDDRFRPENVLTLHSPLRQILAPLPGADTK